MIYTYIAQSDSQQRERDLTQRIERRRAVMVRHATTAVPASRPRQARRSLTARARRTIYKLVRSTPTA